MTMLLLFFSLLLAACGDRAPAPLPPSQRETWHPRGRMVAMSTVRGYLVLPEQPPGEGILLLVDAVDTDTRTRADGLAREGWVALAVNADISTAAAAAYLDGLPSTSGMQQRCLRAGGCGE